MTAEGAPMCFFTCLVCSARWSLFTLTTAKGTFPFGPFQGPETVVFYPFRASPCARPLRKRAQLWPSKKKQTFRGKGPGLRASSSSSLFSFSSESFTTVLAAGAGGASRAVSSMAGRAVYSLRGRMKARRPWSLSWVGLRRSVVWAVKRVCRSTLV